MTPARFLLCALALAAVPLSVPLTRGQAQAAPAPVSCAPNGKLSFLCGVSAVEDLVPVPGGRWIVGSSMTQGPVGLYLIDTRAKTAKPADITVSTDTAAMKPFAGCPAPDFKAMTTHGLEIVPGAGGKSMVYAVNHGGRESVEAFRLDASGPEPKAEWLGCVMTPPGVSANSMAALPGGGLLISKFQEAGDAQAIAKMLKGEVTGTVYAWRPGQGWSELPGVRLSGDNGLVVSKDGKFVFIAVWGGQAVQKVALDGSVPTKTVAVDFRPDNLRWAPDGKIFVTGQHLTAENRAGPHGWSTLKLDPETMALTPVVAHQPGVPGFDDATTALQVGDELWFGTFRGDRIAYMPAK